MQQVEERRQIALDAQLEHAARRPLQILDRPLRGHAALVHHDDVVADVFDVGQQMRRENQVDALVVRQVAHQLQHLVAALRVHAVGRLVEEQQIGVVDERLRQLDALLHARRIGLDVAVARFAQAHVVEHFVRALHRVDRGEAGQLAAIGDERHRVHAGNVAVALRHVAEPGANFVGLFARRRGPAPASARTVGLTNPSSALSIVLFPAPFGPSRPIAPAGNWAVTSRSARFLPYSTVTASSVTTGPVGAGLGACVKPGVAAGGRLGAGWRVGWGGDVAHGF